MLKYHEENTAMYDAEGNLVCFDVCELFDKDIGLEKVYDTPEYTGLFYYDERGG